MRLSCNGCRVLRKGCSDSCSIRPCLQWIKSPDAQANATVFLAKFYGRAGLMNLIDAGAEGIRPAIFRSLLYEACGRIVNPVYGSVGLLWSGNWHMCQAAVEAVLKGAPIVQISSADAAAAAAPPHLLPAVKQAVYDIRHNNNKQQQHAASSSSSHGNNGGDGGDAASAAVPVVRAEKDAGVLHKVAKPGRPSFKRTSTTKPAAGKPKQQQQQPPPLLRQADEHRHASPDHHHEEDEHHHASSASSVSHVSQAEQSTDNQQQQQHDDSFFQDSEEQQQPGPALDLTLGFAPLTAAAPCFPPPAAPTVPVTGGCAAGEPGFVGLRFL